MRPIGLITDEARNHEGKLMAAKKRARVDGASKVSNVIPIGTRRSAPIAPRHELRHLISEVRACASSAENILLRSEPELLAVSEHAHHWSLIDQPDEVLKREIDRLRRMLVAWEVVGLKAGNDHDARMHFTMLVDFCAKAVRDISPTHRRSALEQHATLLVVRIQSLFKEQARRLDVALVAQAIDRRSRGGKWDWKSIVRAWGNPDMSTTDWPVRWNEWRKSKTK